MIKIEKARDIYGALIDLPPISSQQNITISDANLTVLPALIDPHVHFRTPGLEYKEDWRTAAKAALYGGYTTVFDMPNTLPPTITQTYLTEKKALIDAQLGDIGIPLRYQLFFGADKKHLTEIAKVKHDIIGIKVFMGCSTGNLVIDDAASLEKVFQIAAAQHLIVAVHAEDEDLLQKRTAALQGRQDYAVHSEIRNIEVACRAIKKAIALTARYQTKLYILHVSSQAEIQLIDRAKQAGLPVYAETTPHHLFLDATYYPALQGKAVVNPPLRLPTDRMALFAAIHAGIIDTIGSDHAPHLLSEKEKPYGACPAGMPGIETTLSLLLNAHYAQLLSLDEIVALTSARAREIFNLPLHNDIVLVDLKKTWQVTEKSLKTKCKWSPYKGQILHGCPVYTILKGHCYDLRLPL
jgi:dihydroorotase